MTAEQLKNEFLKGRAELIAEAKAKGWYYPELEKHGERHTNEKDIYTIYGGLDYYFLKCSQLGITPKCITSLNYEAQGDGFTFEYVEHDIILAIDRKEQNSKYTVEQLSPSRWFVKFRTEKGQNLTVELGRITTPEKLTKSDLMYMWVKNGRLPAPLATWWDVKVYAYDAEGACFHWYNPQVKEVIEQHAETVYPRFSFDEPRTVTKISKQHIINFDWILEATEQNAKKILDEVEKMANSDIKVIVA